MPDYSLIENSSPGLIATNGTRLRSEQSNATAARNDVEKETAN